MQIIVLAGCLLAPVSGQQPTTAGTLDTAAIDRAIGKSGQAIGDVYKISFPRSDLHIT